MRAESALWSGCAACNYHSAAKLHRVVRTLDFGLACLGRGRAQGVGDCACWRSNALVLVVPSTGDLEILIWVKRPTARFVTRQVEARMLRRMLPWAFGVVFRRTDTEDRNTTIGDG